MCFRILFFLSYYQDYIRSNQTIIIKLANNNSGDLIKFYISSLDIYKPRLEIYIFKLKIYISNLKIEFVFQQINFLYACYQLFYDSFTEINPEIGDTMTKSDKYYIYGKIETADVNTE